MPLGRYFAFAGSVLLALLLFADWYMPASSAEPQNPDVDRSIIRIHTLHRWPEAVVFDTSLPTIVPPPVVTTENPVKNTPGDALAMLPQPLPPVTALSRTAEAKPAAMKRRSRTTRVATRRIADYRMVSSGDWFLRGWQGAGP